MVQQVDLSQLFCFRWYLCRKKYIWNRATCSCKSGKYLASIINDSLITCDEIIDAEAKFNNEERKTILKNTTCKTKSFYIQIVFSLTKLALLIAASIYCYVLKYKEKQKLLLPFYVTNNEVKKVLITIKNILIIYYKNGV